MGKPADLVQGTLDFLILKAVELEPRHGWGIVKRIQQISGDDSPQLFQAFLLLRRCTSPS